jgi:hypothetical protein
MGNPNYSISTRLTGETGATMLTKLSAEQAAAITGIIPAQIQLLHEIVETRRAICTQLRRYISGDTVDRDAVMSLEAQYGRLDGQIVYAQAAAFATIGQSLSDQQKAGPQALREQVGVGVPQGGFLYSTPIQMPAIPNTDFLFGVK